MHHTEHDKAQGTSIRKVLEYIQLNLSEDLRLEVLAKVANYSPFHFQRLFLEQVGETPKQYIIRLRLERMAHYMKIFPNLSVSEVSIESGFASLSTFSRAFKNYFGVSAEEYKKMTSGEYSKFCKTNRKKSKTPLLESSDLWSRDFSSDEIMNWKKKVHIETLKQPAIMLICQSTCLGKSDAISLAFRELCRWAASRGLLTTDTRFMGMLLDIPFITPLNKCRYWAGITFPEHISLPTGVNATKVDAGTYARYSIKGDLLSTVKSLVFFSHGWLPGSGYAIKTITGFEEFAENPADKPSETIVRNIMIPVKPA